MSELLNSGQHGNWENCGLLEGLSPVQKVKVAKSFDNYEDYFNNQIIIETVALPIIKIIVKKSSKEVKDIDKFLKFLESKAKLWQKTYSRKFLRENKIDCEASFCCWVADEYCIVNKLTSKKPNPINFLCKKYKKK